MRWKLLFHERTAVQRHLVADVTKRGQKHSTCCEFT